jgi:MoaE-MoaD fusion protein
MQAVPHPWTADIQLFAAPRQLLNRSTLRLELDGSLTAGQLKAQLAERFPELLPWLESGRLAVDRQLVGDQHPVPIGAEVALIPPVSGG